MAKKQKHKIQETVQEKYKGIPIEMIATDKNKKVNMVELEHCPYLKGKNCLYYDGKCNPYSVRCHNKRIFTVSKTDNLFQEKKPKKPKHIKRSVEIKTIVLSHNRKCFVEGHNIIDIEAIVNVLFTRRNIIIQKKIPAAYCPICNQYIILKSDFKELQKCGAPSAKLLIRHRNFYRKIMVGIMIQSLEYIH